MIELDLRLPLRRFELALSTRLTDKVTAIVGPSGAGKTSLLEVIAGLRAGATGRITVDGHTLLDSARGVQLPPEKRRIGYVPQQPALFPHLNVERNIRYGLARGATAHRQTVAEIVNLLGLEALLARYPRTLSGGEAQRVALARALVVEPRLLLLDEPLAALDSDLKSRILPYLMRVREERRTPMLYVTHHVGEALALSDGAMVLNSGRLEAQGEAARVLTPAVLANLHRGATFENVVHGTIVGVSAETGIATLALPPRGAAASFLLAVPATEGLEVGQHATYRLASEDLLLLRDAPGPISARNLFRAEVMRIELAGHEAIAHLEAEGAVWRAQLTPAAVTELALTPKRAVWVAIKTVAFELLEAGGSR